jgi:TatD DNase family protein
VRGHQEILHLLAQNKVDVPVIFHGFRGSWPLAQQIIQKGYFLGIGPWCLVPQASVLVENVPLEHIMPESDDGQMKVDVIYQRIAQLKNISELELKQSKRAQALSIFGPQTLDI